MSPKANIPHNIIFLMVLILSAIMIIAKSESTNHENHTHGDAFGFIQKLKGCHRGQNTTGIHKLKRYLEKFGYLNHHDHENDEFDDALESAVKLYQQKYGLKVTGTLDDATAEQMSMPRCGYPDNDDDDSNSTNHHHNHRHSRKLIHGVSRYSFFSGSPRWPASKSQLTYRFTAGAAPVTADARSACARAFRRWEQVSHFRFQEVSGSVSDIEIGFHRGNHGDGARNAFDGRGGTLAHAFAPTRGLFHYDADERWTVDPTRDGGLDLESVAVHEIGHVLGLYHEPGVRDAIMFPSFSYGSVKRDLHADDIQGIRTLYGLRN